MGGKLLIPKCVFYDGVLLLCSQKCCGVAHPKTAKRHTLKSSMSLKRCYLSLSVARDISLSLFSPSLFNMLYYKSTCLLLVCTVRKTHVYLEGTGCNDVVHLRMTIHRHALSYGKSDEPEQ